MLPGFAKVSYGVAFLAFLFAISGTARAQQLSYPAYVNGARLAALCQNGGTECTYYVAAVADERYWNGQDSIANGVADSDACIPGGTPVSSLVEAVRKFITTHPQAISDPSGPSVVGEALDASFPCL